MSIKVIKETFKIPEKFHLKEVSSEEVKKIIKSLNKKKSAISSCIPVNILIDSVESVSTLKCTFLVSLLVFAKIITARNILC